MREDLEALIAHAGSGSRLTPVPGAAGGDRAPRRSSSRGSRRSRSGTTGRRTGTRSSTIDKAQRLLGWEPRLSNAEALCETYDWYLAHRGDAARCGRHAPRALEPAGARAAQAHVLERLTGTRTSAPRTSPERSRASASFACGERDRLDLASAPARAGASARNSVAVGPRQVRDRADDPLAPEQLVRERRDVAHVDPGADDRRRPCATWPSASGTSSPAGANRIAASSSPGGPSAVSPAHVAPSDRANACASRRHPAASARTPSGPARRRPGRRCAPPRRTRTARSAPRRPRAGATGSRSARRREAAPPRTSSDGRRHREAEPLVGDAELRVAAVQVVAGEPRAVAEVLAAGDGSTRTRRTSSRATARRRGRRATNRPALVDDLGDDLVAEDEGQLRAAELAVDDVQVGAADAAREHAEERLRPSQRRLGGATSSAASASSRERRGAERRHRCSSSASRCNRATIVHAAVAYAAELLDYRAEFPILEHTTYLINHSLAAMPRRAEDRLAEYARMWGERGIRALGRGLVDDADDGRRPGRPDRRRAGRARP